MSWMASPRAAIKINPAFPPPWAGDDRMDDLWMILYMIGSHCETGRGLAVRPCSRPICHHSRTKNDFINTYWSAFGRERSLFADAQGASGVFFGLGDFLDHGIHGMHGIGKSRFTDEQENPAFSGKKAPIAQPEREIWYN